METPNTVSSIQEQYKMRSAEKCINKTLLTPCRRVGLKRKSLNPSHKKCLESISKCPTATSPNNFIDDKELKVRKLDLDTTEDLQQDKQTNSKCMNKTAIVRELNSGGEKYVKQNKSNDMIEKHTAGIKTNTGFNTEETNTTAKKPISKEDNPEIVTFKPKLLIDIVYRIKQKEMQLQSMDKSEVYAKKHDPNVLKELIVKWRSGCQEALKEMRSLMAKKGMNMSMTQLLNQFRISHDLIQFSEDSGEFDE